MSKGNRERGCKRRGEEESKNKKETGRFIRKLRQRREEKDETEGKRQNVEWKGG